MRGYRRGRTKRRGYLANDVEGVARADAAALDHLAEHTLTRHDAVPHLVVDRTVLVTLLADLRELQHRIAHEQNACRWEAP